MLVPHKLGPLGILLLTSLIGCGDDAAGTGGGGAGATTGGPTGGPAPATGTNGTSGTMSTTGGPSTSSSASTTSGMQASTFTEMCAAPGVIFCDGFEGAWDSSWMEDGGDVEIIPGAAVPNEGASVIQLSTYENVQTSKLLRTFPDADRIHIRFDVQYDAAYDNSGGSHGLILGGSDSPPWGVFGTAGQHPNGSDYFVLNFEPWGTVGDDAAFAFYAYFVNMQPDGNGNYWGNVFESTRGNAQVTPGAWQCAEYSHTLNDPGSENGSADFWVEGVHQGTYANIEWRTDPNLRITTFALDSYNHMNNGPIPASQPNRVYYDNFVISSDPVGCLD